MKQRIYSRLIKSAVFVLGFAALTAGSLFLPSAVVAQSSAAQQPPITARVVVKFKKNASLLQKQAQSAKTNETLFEAKARSHAEQLSTRVGLRLSAGRLLTERTQVLLADGMTSEQLVQRLSKEADIEYVVVDHVRKRNAIPNDPLFNTGPAIAGQTGGPVSGQWYLRAPSGEVRSAINAQAAWDITVGNPGVVVAVLDSGIRFDHVDLKRVSEGGNLLDGYDFISGTFTGNDGDGRDADASDTGDGVNAAALLEPGKPSNCTSADIEDSSWHGTKVAGLIGALTDNGIGMASVGRTVRILPVRVLGRCGGFDSDIVAGMRWATGLNVPGVPDNPQPNRARVINMSLGGSGSCTALYIDAVREINALGAVVVASAGNSAGQAVSVPAKCEGVIGVSGLRHIGTKVGFSDLGPEITISAPGGNCVNVGAGDACLYPILSASNSGTTAPVLGAAGSVYTDAFKPTVGTSFSAPLVAGTAALMLSVRPAMSPADVRSLLRSSAQPFPTTGSTAGVVQCSVLTATSGEECYCNTSTCGAGMLDAGRAVKGASAGLQASFTVSPAAPVVGQTITLNPSSTWILSGRSIQSRSWSITEGSELVTALPTPASDGTLPLGTTGSGTVTVVLTVTDDLGTVSTASQTFTVSSTAASPQARITFSPAVPVAGQTITFSSASSTVGSPQDIQSISWTVSNDGGIVNSPPGNGASYAVTPNGAGSFTVRLTITNRTGLSFVASKTVAVAAAPVTPTPEPPSGGGGGGATTSLYWLLGIALAAWALRSSERRSV